MESQDRIYTQKYMYFLKTILTAHLTLKLSISNDLQ